MPDAIDMTAEEIAQLYRAAMSLVQEYYASLPRLPVMPQTSAAEVRDKLSEPLPELPARIDDVLATVRDIVYPLCRHNGHPRFFGYVASPGTPVTAAAELLVSALNANVTSWRSAPAAAEMEHVVIDWIKEMLGYPATAAGLFVSGGSSANLAGLAAARAAKAPGWGSEGSRGTPLRVYVSEEGHFSNAKAAGLLGIGSDNVVNVPMDDQLRMNAEALRRAVSKDIAAGYAPMCVVANAGSTNAGAFDRIGALADIAHQYGLWLHVDAAYGGFAALAPSARHLFSDIGKADSVTLDPHKWLYGSMGCGCILYRDPASARAAFGHSADYTRAIGLGRDESFAFWDFGPELSRPFRALGLWMQMKVYGAQALANAIEQNMECARYFATLVDESDDFEMLAPVGLSIFSFRYAPAGFSGDLDALNERVLIDLQKAGSSYLSNGRIRGKFALRGCVLNYRTTKEDMRILLRDLREAARIAHAAPGTIK
jgi:aromatic-L-amino-acid decarboxylase